MSDPGSAADFFRHLDLATVPRLIVAVGGNLDPDTLIAAYRAGCFPWPSAPSYETTFDREVRHLVESGEIPLLPGADPSRPLLPWMSPHPRPVLLPDRVTIPRSLRKRLRHCGWETTMDSAFDEVIAACAERTETWITKDMAHAYRTLHRAGHAHSLEVWDGDALIGGLYGVRTGRVFSGESMFHRVSDASKAAVVDLCDRFVEMGVVVVDTQDESDHMIGLGQILVHRSDFVDALRHFRDEPATPVIDRRPVGRLVEPLSPT